MNDVAAEAAVVGRNDKAAGNGGLFRFLPGFVLILVLFIAGRGVNLASKDALGKTALEIARARGNTQMAQLLARNLPAAR